MTQNPQTILNYKFTDKDLQQQALTHSSYSYEKDLNNLKNNERLEFLGDAVLQIVVSEYLYHTFPKMREGDLTKLRSSVVCEPTLATAARDLGIAPLLVLGRGEEQAGGRDRDSILGDTLEAIIGAIFLDGGLDPAKKFVLDTIVPHIKLLSESNELGDYKTRLQEMLQKKTTSPPKYVTVEESGPDHKKTFTIHVIHKNKIMGIGVGKSKKEAEQHAAQVALEKYKRYAGKGKNKQII
ncbi:MAG: ribonuclease III [Defluviitaleaceae bacterium]|nr:ribonuclease III [Defluviitaleaceae bacterium]